MPFHPVPNSESRLPNPKSGLTPFPDQNQQPHFHMLAGPIYTVINLVPIASSRTSQSLLPLTGLPLAYNILLCEIAFRRHFKPLLPFAVSISRAKRLLCHSGYSTFPSFSFFSTSVPEDTAINHDRPAGRPYHQSIAGVHNVGTEKMLRISERYSACLTLGLLSCDVSDALCKLKVPHGGFLPGLTMWSPQRQDGNTKIIGPAYTVQYAPLDDPRPKHPSHYVRLRPPCAENLSATTD